jgi:hypothetical protein
MKDAMSAIGGVDRLSWQTNNGQKSAPRLDASVTDDPTAILTVGFQQLSTSRDADSFCDAPEVPLSMKS